MSVEKKGEERGTARRRHGEKRRRRNVIEKGEDAVCMLPRIPGFILQTQAAHRSRGLSCGSTCVAAR